MNRITPLLRTAAVELARFDHVPHEPHRDPETERAEGYALNFVEAGSFRVRVGGDDRVLSTGSIFSTRPGLEFSCRHDHEHPDDRCLSVSYSGEAIESLRGAGAAGESPAIIGLTHRRAYLQRQIGECGRGDNARVEALAGALFFTLAPHEPAAPAFRANLFSWHASRVDRAKALIDARCHEPLSLGLMAKDAGMSLYHFARVFRELQGEPPHRYLAQARLARALDRLLQGASVTDTCYDVGFGSLSHFVTAFRRRYGVRPSDVRRGINARPTTPIASRPSA